MTARIFLFAWVLLGLSAHAAQPPSQPYHGWKLLLKRANHHDAEIARLPADMSKSYSIAKKIDNLDVVFTLRPQKGYTVFKASAKSKKMGDAVFFSLEYTYQDGEPFNFDGPVTADEVYRQSPHDVNAWIVHDIAEQAVPVIGLRQKDGFIVALNSAPAFYKNFTSQAFYTSTNTIALRSGDDGAAPGKHPTANTNLLLNYNTDKTQTLAPGKIMQYYHPANKPAGHVFDGIIFHSPATTTAALRQDINYYAAVHFSKGRYKDAFGSLSFTTSYMNLRYNETRKSEYWVVPSVEYANTQYGRDAFWISSMLPASLSSECLKNELDSVNHYAEYALFVILWAFRLEQEGQAINHLKLQKYWDAIEKHARQNQFYSYDENDGRLDFQYWADLIAFEKDDVIAYNQGLFTLAIRAAGRMKLIIHSDSVAALRHYRSFFHEEEGCFAISQKKPDITGPDPLVADLLSQVYFGTPLLDSNMVAAHYLTMLKNLKTPFGFKALARTDGSFLSDKEYDVQGYLSQANKENLKDGQYLRGGSYFLYDNLFLLDAYLHHVPGALELLVWRVGLDFKIGGTTFECLNTIDGDPWKPNMGWNVAIYACWNKLLADKRVTRDLLTGNIQTAR